jgi:hypothetical protein
MTVLHRYKLFRWMKNLLFVRSMMIEPFDNGDYMLDWFTRGNKEKMKGTKGR